MILMDKLNKCIRRRRLAKNAEEFERITDYVAAAKAWRKAGKFDRAAQCYDKEAVAYLRDVRDSREYMRIYASALKSDTSLVKPYFDAKQSAYESTLKARMYERKAGRVRHGLHYLEAARKL